MTEPTPRASLSRPRGRFFKARVAAGAIGAGVLAIGALHAPFARPFLQRMGGCPMAGARMTSTEMEAARKMALGGEHAGENRGAQRGRPAPARPALGFALDVTTLDDVHRWARRAHVDCDDVHDGLVKCTAVAPAALGIAPEQGRVDELALGFDVHRRLVNVTTLRTHLAPDAAAQAAQRILASLGNSLGPAPYARGAFTGAGLARPGAYSLASSDYRYDDYVAEVVAMNAPRSGPSVREHYMSAND